MKSILAFASLAVAASCTVVGPDYVRPRIDLPQHYTFAHSAALNTAAEEHWWQGLNDPVLNDLMIRGLARNLDVRTAQERIAEAQANYRATGVAAQVSDESSLGATYTDTDGRSDTDSFAQFGARYVFDLFGGVARRREQARAELESREFDAAATRLALQSELAAAYIEARYFQDALAITRRSIANRERTLGLIASMIQAGDATQVDSTRAQAELFQIEADLPNLQNGFEINVLRLATLLADPAAPHLARLRNTQSRLNPSARFDAGVPANLLRNRPDVLASERNLAARMAAVGVAEAALYPSLVVAGSVRVDDSTGISFGPTLSIPLLGRARLTAQRDAAVSLARQAELGWRNTVLSAVSDVERALIGIENRQREIASLERATRNFTTLRRLSGEAFELGATTVLELLDAEQEIRRSELALAQARRNLAIAVSELAIATGRGARTAPSEPAADPSLVLAEATRAQP